MLRCVMNKVTLLGNLTKDVELRYIEGTACANISIAHNKHYKTKEGKEGDIVLYVEAVCFGRTAEVINQYFKKGSRILVSGELRLNAWQDKEGKTRQKHFIAINEFWFIDKKSDGKFNNYVNSNPDMVETIKAVKNPNENQSQGRKEPPIVYENQEENIPAIDIDTDEIPF